MVGETIFNTPAPAVTLQSLHVVDVHPRESVLISTVGGGGICFTLGSEPTGKSSAHKCYLYPSPVLFAAPFINAEG